MHRREGLSKVEMLKDMEGKVEGATGKKGTLSVIRSAKERKNVHCILGL